jgi:hypothetical protein
MPFVPDASIAACWAFDDEDHPVAALALERVRTDAARVPSLWLSFHSCPAAVRFVPGVGLGPMRFRGWESCSSCA